MAVRLTGGLSARAYFFSGLPMDAQFPGDCPKGQTPEFSLLDGFSYSPLTRGGLSVQFRSGFACPPRPVDISCFQSCQALLPAAVDCHAQLALVASLRTRGSCPEQTRTRRCLLGGDGLPQILHGYQAFQVLVYFHLQSGVAGAIRTRQQLQRSRVVLDGVVSGHLAGVLEAKDMLQGQRRVQGTIGWSRFLCLHSEFLIEAGQEAALDVIGLIDGGCRRSARASPLGAYAGGVPCAVEAGGCAGCRCQP